MDAGYTPAHWPAEFVEAMLGRVVASFAAREHAPAMRLHATDTGATYGTSGPRQPVVGGPQHALPAWLMGRSLGADLLVRNALALPAPPFLY
ncbi:hypothetical protein [Kitasatospora sp. NPDC048407]|uniref:hypothetical protein n=1 Tax=Kitasatospora sp. NPDC048407 TaxID=3364051 RepID=UPI00371DBB05